MPRFSVVVPVFNRAALIGDTLDSILAQGFDDDFEIVVVDDGSTDGSLDVLRAYTERHGERIRVVQQQNAGPGKARNAGIEAARGDYIAFLDSDDLWLPWTLSTYARVIKEHGEPAFVAGAPRVFHEPGEVRALAQSKPEELRCEAFADYFGSGETWRWFSASSFVMRRDALRKVGGFTPEWVNGEDADLTFRMGTERGFVDVQAPPTFAYRQHEGSAMSNSARTVAGIALLLTSEKAGLYPGGQARAEERWKMITRHVRPVCLSCLKAGRRAQAWAFYRATTRAHVRQKRWKFLLAFVAQSARFGVRSSAEVRS